jgi:cyclopropane fatty-acyl-phospholipid synthase-like methyltransferase
MFFMLKNIRRMIGMVDHNIDLPLEDVERIVTTNNVHPWFCYMFKERKNRIEVVRSCEWVLRNCRKTDSILETGCGCALNLIWLGQQGFTRLFGADLDENVLRAAKELANLAGLNIEFWQDNSALPKRIPPVLDVVLALNWISLIQQFDLSEFFRCYYPGLSERGYLILEVVDTRYEKVPNHQYLTSDWTKPEAERRPSEYKSRFSHKDVLRAANAAGFEICEMFSAEVTIPWMIYVLRKL